jgi:hypothetical protein
LSAAGSVVTAIVDQLAHDAPNRLRAETAAAERRIDKEVDRRMLVAGLKLFEELDQPGDGAVNLNYEAGRIGLVVRKVLRRLVPPSRHLRRLVDP